MSAHLTIPEAAKLFTCTPATVGDWIRKGMPASTEVKKNTGRRGKPKHLVDPVAARNWLIEHNVRTFMKSEVAASAAAAPVAAVVAAPVPVAADPAKQAMNIKPGVDGAVDRLRQIELRAFSDYVKARNAGDVMGQRAHMKLHSEAVKRMLEAEGEVDDHKGVEAEQWGRMTEALQAWADAVKSLVEQMPRALASRCNVTEPAVAEKALRDWVDTQLYPMMGRDPKV
jgi:hypothetical protein